MMLPHVEEAYIQIEVLSWDFRSPSRPSILDRIFLYRLHVIDLRQGRSRIQGTSVKPLYMFIISRAELSWTPFY